MQDVTDVIKYTEYIILTYLPNTVCVLDLEFQEYVIPTKIEILETYNPGAVVRILALLRGSSNSDKQW